MRYWAPYVPVGERRARAWLKMNELRDQGMDVQPVEIEGRAITRRFWGKGWCEHLESFSDYENRLPRGRTYVRNGSVCHLEIRPGQIKAIVSGSELYNITIRIKKLKPSTWKAVKKKCSGQIGSMLELLQGRLSDQVMAVVTDREAGLFPKPGEIELNCDCPDWAVMCKHVAAVLYGIGHRLDSRPELLFILRDVDAQELISTEMTLPADAATAADALADDQLSDIFGVELDSEADTEVDSPAIAKTDRAKRGKKRKTTTTGRRSSGAGKKKTTSPTGRAASSSASRSRPAKKTKRRTGKAADSRIGKTAKRGTGKKAKRKIAKKKQSVRASVRKKHVPLASSGNVKPRIRPTGKSVARLRKQLGLTVAQFARLLGVSTASVYRWQATSGRLKPQPQTLSALAVLQRQAGKSR